MITTYRTRYIDHNGKQALLTIGIDNIVAANTLLKLPTFCSSDIVLDITKYCALSDTFNIWFPVVFQSV